MVTEVRINNDNTPFPYACRLPAFKKGQTYTFKEGVNIIVGENGCGKSTLLNTIKAYLTIDNIQCGRGMFNHCINSLYRTFDLKHFKDGADVYADYERNSFAYLEIKDQETDLVMSSFDKFAAAYEAKHISRGQSVIYSMEKFLEEIFSEKTNHWFDYQKQYADRTAYLEYIEKHKITGNEWTLLLDEPDNNLSLESLEDLYGVLSFHKEHVQIIAVIHNPLLISRISDKCNVIEMTKGYVGKIKKQLKKWLV